MTITSIDESQQKAARVSGFTCSTLFIALFQGNLFRLSFSCKELALAKEQKIHGNVWFDI